MFFEICDLYSFLFPRIAIPDSDRLILERLVVDSDTERCSYLILARIEFTYSTSVVVNGAQARLQ